MPLVSQSEVEAIIDFDSSIEDFTPFIEAADELVQELCMPVYGTRRSKVIEKWLAAHFLAIRDPRYASETLGGASVGYLQQGGLNLKSTPYGQQAKLLDTNGNLAWIDEHISQGKRTKVGIISLGTNHRASASFPWRFYAFFA